MNDLHLNEFYATFKQFIIAENSHAVVFGIPDEISFDAPYRILNQGFSDVVVEHNREMGKNIVTCIKYPD